MTLAPFVAVALACAGAVAFAIFLGRRIAGAMARSARLDAEQRLTLAKATAAFGFVALGPAILLGIVVGGTLGATYGVAGIALGTFAVVALILCLAVAGGAWVGRWLAARANIPFP